MTAEEREELERIREGLLRNAAAASGGPGGRGGAPPGMQLLHDELEQDEAEVQFVRPNPDRHGNSIGNWINWFFGTYSSWEAPEHLVAAFDMKLDLKDLVQRYDNVELLGARGRGAAGSTGARSSSTSEAEVVGGAVDGARRGRGAVGSAVGTTSSSAVAEDKNRRKSEEGAMPISTGSGSSGSSNSSWGTSGSSSSSSGPSSTDEEHRHRRRKDKIGLQITIQDGVIAVTPTDDLDDDFEEVPVPRGEDSLLQPRESGGDLATRGGREQEDGRSPDRRDFFEEDEEEEEIPLLGTASNSVSLQNPAPPVTGEDRKIGSFAPHDLAKVLRFLGASPAVVATAGATTTSPSPATGASATGASGPPESPAPPTAPELRTPDPSGEDLPLSSLVIQKDLYWEGFDRLKLRIRRRVRESGFRGKLCVAVSAGPDLVVVQRNCPWDNFMRDTTAAWLFFLSVVGILWYFPYRFYHGWVNAKRVRSAFTVTKNADEYWEMVDAGLGAVVGR